MAAPAGTRTITYRFSGEPGPNFMVEVTTSEEGPNAFNAIDPAVEAGADAIVAWLQANTNWASLGGGADRVYEGTIEGDPWSD